MCLVARGCNDAYYEYGIYSWDVSTGAIIVEEAGGILVDTNVLSIVYRCMGVFMMCMVYIPGYGCRPHHCRKKWWNSFL